MGVFSYMECFALRLEFVYWMMTVHLQELGLLMVLVWVTVLTVSRYPPKAGILWAAAPT
jgi:hypothetical protein